MKLIAKLVILIFSLGSSANLIANGRAGESVEADGVSRLVAQLSEIRTMSGSFVQYTVDQKGSRIQESKGEFMAQRPGMFYWHTREPLEQSIYTDGQMVTVYDPDLEQATIQKLGAQIQSTPAILFSGNIEEVGEIFDVEVREFDEFVTQYLLLPRTQDSLFERLRVRFEGKQLVEMRLSDSLGQESTVRFVQTQINSTLPTDAFTPKFPDGTDIIRDVPVPVSGG